MLSSPENSCFNKCTKEARIAWCTQMSLLALKVAEVKFGILPKEKELMHEWQKRNVSDTWRNSLFQFITAKM
jgi:hypothetical protein